MDVESVAGGAGTNTPAGASGLAAVEHFIDFGAAAATAMGGPVGGAVAAGLKVGEAVANAVVDGEHAGATKAGLATAAAQALVDHVGPLVSTLPAEDQAKVNGGMNLLQWALADLKKVFGWG